MNTLVRSAYTWATSCVPKEEDTGCSLRVVSWGTFEEAAGRSMCTPDWLPTAVVPIGDGFLNTCCCSILNKCTSPQGSSSLGDLQTTLQSSAVISSVGQFCDSGSPWSCLSWGDKWSFISLCLVWELTFSDCEAFMHPWLSLKRCRSSCPGVAKSSIHTSSWHACSGDT